MTRNATNTSQPTVEFVSEATNGDTPVQKLSKQENTEQKPQAEDAISQMKEWLKNNPDFVKSIIGQQEPSKTIEPPIQPTVPTKVKQENVILILANEKKKGTVILDMTDDVFDGKTGKTRRMRLVRGAQSIWQDEQTNLPKEHIAKNNVTLTFDRGRCIIPIHETLKIQAKDVSNRNMDNPNRVGHKDIYFYEWNPEKLNKVEEQKQNKIIEAMQIAATAEYEDLLPHAQYLGVPVNDEMGVPLDKGSIRTAYSKKAMNEPEKFLNSIHSPVVKMAHIVRRAMNEGKIDMGRQPDQAFWTDGGFICAVPQGRDAVNYLTEFGMISGEANERFAQQLRSFYN